MFELEKYLMVIVGLIVLFAEWHQAKKLLAKKKWEIKYLGKSSIDYIWVKWLLGICGLYWAAYYARSILGIELNLHQVWVRTPLLLTLGFIAAGAILSSRRIK